MQFWSGESSHCALPGCESAAITLPGGYQYAEVTIDYTYDPLYRLTAADYDNGDYYHYAYDPVGNRLSQESMVSGLSSVSSYQYDIANRLIDVDGVDYTWDANGNLLSDGVNNYAYDSANRLVGFDGPEGTATYGYNGLGDRLTQNGVTYTLDLNSGLTQVLDDGENTYTYGLGRISQQQGATAEYFLGDALGSVRQLSSAVGEVTLSKSYDPYGSVIQSVGPSQTSYGFASEYTDANGLIYLRARYYSTETGRFLTRDTWSGNVKNPSSFNHWGYGYSNPIQYKDPSGLAATHVDCDRINVMLGNMRSLCKVANGDISDPSIKTAVLDAREQFFREIAKLSNFASNYFGDGYWYAAMMLESFLDSNGYVGVYLSSNSSFQSDPGILRATKLKKPQSGDDAKEITPLLHNFLRIVKNEEICDGVLPNITVRGEDTYTNGQPRPYDTGWWGAFGHVVIDVNYTNSRITTRSYGYYISTTASYTIVDNYHWGDKRGTPLPLGPINSPLSWRPDRLQSIVGSIEIPHVWEESLRDNGYAYEYDFTVKWTERLDIIVPPTFSYFDTQGFHERLDN